MRDEIDLLNHPRSNKRKSAAKKLRIHHLKEACESLLDSLKLELKNKNTWETQYQMVMAIGESQCDSAKKELYHLLNNNTMEPMVKLAFADAITRIENNSGFLTFALNLKDIDLIQGALRGMTFKKIPLPNQILDELINFTLSFKDNLTCFWIAASAPNCESMKLKSLLEEWSFSTNKDLSKAATESLKNKYVKWSIL
jgi:hypothetical protein